VDGPTRTTALIVFQPANADMSTIEHNVNVRKVTILFEITKIHLETICKNLKMAKTPAQVFNAELSDWRAMGIIKISHLHEFYNFDYFSTEKQAAQQILHFSMDYFDVQGQNWNRI
jgi:hypothetical protein